MPRTLTSAAVTQLEATFVRPTFLVSMAFANETIYAWTGVGPLVWNGQTWLGVGNLGDISPIVEGSDVSAQGITLTLSEIPAELLNDSMSELMAGKLAQVYLGFLDSSGALIADPIPAFIGLIDQPTIDLATDKASISITVENRLADLNRARGGRYTDQDQRARYPNDGCLKYVHFLQDEHFTWQ